MEAHHVVKKYFSMHGVHLIMPEMDRKRDESSISACYLKTHEDTLNLLSVPGLSHWVEVVLNCMGGATAMQSHNHSCGSYRAHTAMNKAGGSVEEGKAL